MHFLLILENYFLLKQNMTEGQVFTESMTYMYHIYSTDFNNVEPWRIDIDHFSKVEHNLNSSKYKSCKIVSSMLSREKPGNLA